MKCTHKQVEASFKKQIQIQMHLKSIQMYESSIQMEIQTDQCITLDDELLRQSIRAGFSIVPVDTFQSVV